MIHTMRHTHGGKYTRRNIYKGKSKYLHVESVGLFRHGTIGGDEGAMRGSQEKFKKNQQLVSGTFEGQASHGLDPFSCFLKKKKKMVISKEAGQI